MEGQTLGNIATGVQSNLTGIGSLVMYAFALVGVVLAGMGIHGFYAAHKNPGGQHTIGKAAIQTIVGVILAGGLTYMINSGSMTFGNNSGTTQLQQVINP